MVILQPYSQEVPLTQGTEYWEWYWPKQLLYSNRRRQLPYSNYHGTVGDQRHSEFRTSSGGWNSASERSLSDGIFIPIQWTGSEAEEISKMRTLAKSKRSNYKEPPICDENLLHMYPSFDDDASDYSDSEDSYNDVTSLKPWIPRLHLNISDQMDLVKGKMLSDKHIYAAQKLLREQFPQIGGFQDTCLSQTGFESVESESIQVHHTRGNHWVVSSSLGGRVVVYDSLYNDITQDLQDQINAIYTTSAKDERGDVITEIPRIGKQFGSRDCGLYCIAIAYELCLGNDVTNINFDQRNMRQHLLRCFQNIELRSFPIL